MSDTISHFIWYELMTSDVEAAERFYGEVVGWRVVASGQPGQDYRQWMVGDLAIGGLMAIPPDAAAHGMRPLWAGYLNVDDVDAAVEQLVAAGGSVHAPPWDIPGVGRMSMVADPQGAMFYLMVPIGEGPSPSHMPGKPGHGGWHELHTTDWRAALDFYVSQFGWRQSEALDMGVMGTYLLFNTGGDAVGGMMNSPASFRPNWLFYFNVQDIDAANARVEAAGGEVLQAPHQVPGGNWVMRARDPQGAMFALVGSRSA